MFFGTANGLLERIRKRVEAGPLRFLVVDLRRVTGMDSSAVVAFAQGRAPRGGERVRAGLHGGVGGGAGRSCARGGVVATDGVVRFEPDLDRGLQRCEDGLLAGAAGERVGAPDVSGEALAGMPPGLVPYLERETLAEGAVLIRQDAPPDDVFVLESGRLSVETVTPGGTRMRLRTMRPGVVVGEVAMYSGVPRTADVVAEAPSVVLRLTRASIERMEGAEPQLAAAVHRWLARTLAERLGDSLKTFDALID